MVAAPGTSEQRRSSSSGPGCALTMHPEQSELPYRWSAPRTVNRELDESPVPPRCATGVHPARVRGNGRHPMAHLPDPHQALQAARVAGRQKLKWPPNVWMGVSVETSRYAFRIDHLGTAGAAVRFVSAEPMLGHLSDLVLCRHRLADHRRRERPELPAHAEGVRQGSARPVRLPPGSPSSSSSGAAAAPKPTARTWRHPPQRNARGTGEGVSRCPVPRRRQPVPRTRGCAGPKKSEPHIAAGPTPGESGCSCKLSRSCAPVPRASPIPRTRSEVIRRSPAQDLGHSLRRKAEHPGELGATPAASLELVPQNL